MSFLEAARSALDNLASHKLRSALTMLGMIFGVGAVIAMLSIGSGAESQAMEAIDRMGVRNILVRDNALDDDELAEVREQSLGVSLRDVQAILEGVPGAAMAVPRIEVDTYKIMTYGATTEATVYGLSHRQDEVGQVKVQEGRFLDALDELRHAQVCVIGSGVRRDLFGYEAVIGNKLKINDVWFEVIGVLQDSGEATSFQGVDIGTTETEIYVPVTTAMRKFARKSLEAPLDEIIVQLEEGVEPRTTAVAVRGLLERIHGGEDDYDVIVPEALLEQSRRTQRLFNIVMGCIAGISLLVGGIGIMNIMLATVLERTREIGVRRAVGARRSDIRSQFMIESFTISLLGGLSGVVVGLLIARVVAGYAGWPTVVTFASIVLSTGVSMTVGLVSGIYPAIRASNLDPIDALRHE